MALYYHVLDIETSGLNPKEDEIAELAIITCVNTEVIHIFHRFYEVRKMGEIAGLKNGLSVQQLAGWPKFNSRENLHDVRSTVKFPFFAHNGTFDRNFLIANNAIGEHIKMIDTLKLCKEKPTKLENNKLQTWLAHFQIQAGPAHSALGDALGLARMIMLQGWQIKVTQ